MTPQERNRLTLSVAHQCAPAILDFAVVKVNVDGRAACIFRGQVTQHTFIVFSGAGAQDSPDNDII
jgi:hypothetical protein